MYKQTLYNIIEPIKKTTISRLNKGKKWKYGYNKEHDLIVISRTGQIGDIYEIQNLKIALPKKGYVYSRSKKKEEQYWEQFEKEKQLKNIKTIFDWRTYPDENKNQWYDYEDDPDSYGDCDCWCMGGINWPHSPIG